MKNFIVLFIFLFLPSLLFASDTPNKNNWIFVGNSNTTNDDIYIMRTYEIDGVERKFTFLTNYSSTMGVEKSAIAYDNVTFCDRPHRVMIGDIEGFTGKSGTGKSLGTESNAWWITVPDDSILRTMINMVCKK